MSSKRYLLFITGYHECAGGWKDLFKTSDNLEDIKQDYKQEDINKFNNMVDSYHIVDTVIGDIIEEGEFLFRDTTGTIDKDNIIYNCGLAKLVPFDNV